MISFNCIKFSVENLSDPCLLLVFLVFLILIPSSRHGHGPLHGPLLVGAPPGLLRDALGQGLRCRRAPGTLRCIATRRLQLERSPWGKKRNRKAIVRIYGGKLVPSFSSHFHHITFSLRRIVHHSYFCFEENRCPCQPLAGNSSISCCPIMLMIIGAAMGGNSREQHFHIYIQIFISTILLVYILV